MMGPRCMKKWFQVGGRWIGDRYKGDECVDRESVVVCVYKWHEN